MSVSRLVATVAVPVLLVLTMPGVAAAQSTDSTKSPIKGSLDIGLVAASGNTDLLTFALGQKFEYAKDKWSVKQGAKMVNSTADGVETANEYAVAVEPAYALSSRWKAYALAGWDRNTFLGISTRWQEGLGMSFGAVDGPHHFLTLDAGVSFFQQDFTSGLSSSFPTARAQATYKYAITDKAYVQNIFVYLPNLQDGNDYRMNNELSLVAPVAGPIALKASYVLQYQNEPQPGFGTTDNLYTTGLQVTF